LPPKFSKGQIKIFDFLGKKIFQQEVNFGEKGGQFILEKNALKRNGFSAGLYYITAKFEGFRISKKVIIF